MSIDGVNAVQGLEGGGHVGVVDVGLEPPVSLLNGGTGVRAASNTALLNGVGALPRAGGTMSGNLTVEGGIVVGDPPDGNLGPGTINVRNMIEVNASTATTSSAPAGTGLHIEGEVNPRLLMTSFANSAPTVMVRSAGGTGLAPGPLDGPAGLGNGLIGTFSFGGHDTNGWVTGPARRAGMSAVTLQPWTATAHGCELQWDTTPFNTTQLTLRMRLSEGLVVGNPGGSGVNGTNDMGPGSINAERICLNGTDLGGTSGLPLTGGTLTGPLTINHNEAATLPPINLYEMRVVAPNGSPTRVIVEAFSGNPAIWFRRSQGTGAAPAYPDQAGQILGQLQFMTGANNTTDDFASRIGSITNEPWGDNNKGCNLFFDAIPAGQPTSARRRVMDVGTAGVLIDTPQTTLTGNLTVAGDVVAGSVSPSDRRLKDDIKPFDSGLAVARRLNPISFRYNGLGGMRADGGTRVGVDADEANEILPEMVGRFAHRDLDDIKTVRPETLLYVLLNSVKELALRLEALEQRA